MALVAGQKSLAEAVGELLPGGIERRFDPDASQILQLFDLEMVPFGVRIDSGIVSAKAFLNVPDDVLKLQRGEGALDVAEVGAHENGGPLPEVRAYSSGGGKGR